MKIIQKIKDPFIIIAATLLFLGIASRLFFYFFALKHIPLTWDGGWPSLMAMHILKGELPIVYWGQTYMGTQESFFQAIFIALFGATTAAIRLYPLIVSMLYLVAIFWTAYRYYCPSTALIALAITAIPIPYISMCGALIPPDNYLAVTMLGSFSLILLHQIVFNDTDKPLNFKYFALGFLLGYTFWLHIIVISYIAVVMMFLFLKNKLLLFKKNFWLLVLGFIIGGFPIILYNIIHAGATFKDVAQLTDLPHSLNNLILAFKRTIHFLLGLKVMYLADKKYFLPLPVWLYFPLFGIWIISLLSVIIYHYKSFLKTCLLSVKESNGTPILFTLIFLVLYSFCRSSRAGWHNVRYILPIMSALPVLLAFGLEIIRKKSRWLFIIFFAIVIVSHGVGNFLLVKIWSDPSIVENDLRHPDTTGLRKFLLEHDIHHAYSDFRIAYRISFESQEKIICSEPFNKRFPGKPLKYLEEVRKAEKFAYIFVTKWTEGVTYDRFESFLQNQQAKYKKIAIDSFTVFYDIISPLLPEKNLIQLPKTTWTITASPNNTEAFKAIDEDLETFWNTKSPQVPGTFLEINLGKMQTIAGFRFVLGNNFQDFPRGYTIAISKDRETWKTVQEVDQKDGVLYWLGNHPCFFQNKEGATWTFPEEEARYVRMTITGTKKDHHFFISDLKIYSLKNDASI